MIRLVSSILLAMMVSACSNDTTEEPAESEKKSDAATQRKACDLLGKEQVEQATGLVINNVALRDNGMFSTCNYETDDWQETIGLIYFPGLGTPAGSAALAGQIRQDLEKDGVPYTNLEEESGVGDAAVSYQTDDGRLYTVLAHRGGNRVIISARTREAATTMVAAALAATQ